MTLGERGGNSLDLAAGDIAQSRQAEDLLMNAPSEVMPKQLRELHIRLALPTKE
jgi:hypothetical protein